jgi:ankyrin repeat protein
MLREATRYGQEKVVLWLLEKGIDVNAFPWHIRNTNHSALQIAASLGNLSMVRLLLNRGADVNLNGLNTTGHPSIEGAARCGQEAIVELLIVHGADPRKALLSATAGGQPRLIRLLLNRLPDLPNRKSGDVGRMALLKAFACRNLRAITMLWKLVYLSIWPWSLLSNC